MVPLPPERSAILQSDNGESVIFPYVLTDAEIHINDIYPELPETFTVRCVINGISSSVLRYPEDNESVIWENEGNTLTWQKYPGGNNLIVFYTAGSITINSFELYIDGQKVLL